MNIITIDMMNDLARVDNWLDAEVAQQYKDQPLAQMWGRVAKIGEEYGEVIAALIGATGQNPRKGFTHDMDDVLEELADVVFTALCGMTHITKDVSQVNDILGARLERISKRVHHDLTS